LHNTEDYTVVDYFYSSDLSLGPPTPWEFEHSRSGIYEIFARARCGGHRTDPPQEVSCGEINIESLLCAGFVSGTEREHYGKMKKQFCDERDGKKYVYVEIGEQTWMAENLDYAVEGSKCYDDNCAIYGSFYNWATSMVLPSNCNSYNPPYSCSSQIQSKHTGICPYGWHIPSNADWDKLFRFIDGNKGTGSPYKSETAGKYLKSTSGWNNDGNGTDDYGFSARPGGYSHLLSNSFSEVGYKGRWRSASECKSDCKNEDRGSGGSGYSATYVRGMDYDIEEAFWYDSDKLEMMSVRCVQD
jgi:uncharacterized protein (TIGR02145 family)